MNSDTAQLGGFVLKECWKFFNIKVPGFGFTFAQMAFGVAICIISLLIVKVFFGVGKSVAYRSSSSRRHKISDNRKGDEY